MNRYCRTFVFFLALWHLWPGTVWSGSPPETQSPEPIQDGTTLLFLGEDVDVLTLATRREESASRAPAVAQAINRREFWDQGDTTLARVLDQQPGFYLAPKEYGSVPYLRGIPNSVLFLYDSVPMRSEISKAFHPLDEELPLASIKRIEIVRGPASVLWGMDAFSGVVNVVPLTGKDFQGLETGLLLSEGRDTQSGYVNFGIRGSSWDAFVSLTAGSKDSDSPKANVVRFWSGPGDAPAPPEERYGSEFPENRRFFDITANMSLWDRITLSGRFSDSHIPYTVTDADRHASWIEEKNTRLGYVKLEGQHKFSLNTSGRLSASYFYLSPEVKIIDTTLPQDENTFYAEAILEHSLWFGKGLFTAGASYKKTRVDDAPIWQSYFPDYLGPDNVAFLPDLKFEDLEHSLASFFCQYLHKTSSWDLVAGIRADIHNEYEDSLSTSLGLVWHPRETFLMKFLYGTSFRSPYGRQYVEESAGEDLETAHNFSVQMSWQPRKGTQLEVTGFFTRISDHVTEDPFAGISLPNDQDVWGLEASASVAITDTLSISGNITFFTSDGPDETYRYTEYFIIGPGGTPEEKVIDLNYPFDTGPDLLANAFVRWNPTDDVSLRFRLRYFSERRLVYPRGETWQTVPGVWLADLNGIVKNFLYPGLDVILSVTNITDRDYKTPGTYSLIEGPPLSAQVLVRYRW